MHQVEASKGLKAELCTALWLENWAGCDNTLREQGQLSPYKSHSRHRDPYHDGRREKTTADCYFSDCNS